MFFYVRALEITAKFAARLGQAADATYYSGMATAARTLYKKTFFNATTGCYAGCTYVSQVMALNLGLSGPQGSAEEAAVWANAMAWWANDTVKGVPEHFGGGIISLKLAYPLLDAHGETALALRMHLQSDKPPGFGYWVKVGGATTLWEQYDMTATEGVSSRNHIMFGAAGSWYFSTLAGLGRVGGSRSWQNLAISPPRTRDVFAQLSYASASIDSTMGLVSSGWEVSGISAQGDACGTAPEAAKTLTLTCKGAGKTFTGVAFASYGTPLGSCSGGWTADPTCNANTSVSVVAAACVGKSTCTLSVSNDAFGFDPCFDVTKVLAVALEGEGCSDVSFASTVAIPTGAAATVAIPAALASSPTITEGGTVVWSNGAYAPGVAGITGAQLVGDAVVFSVGSGEYNFVAK